LGNVVKKMLFVVLALLALSACSRYSSNGEEIYLKSRNGVKIEVPPPLTSENIGHYYDLPSQNQDKRVSIAPPVDDITT
jgi:uncharacterized lipoprotein